MCIRLIVPTSDVYGDFVFIIWNVSPTDLINEFILFEIDIGHEKRSNIKEHIELVE